jgi:predicted nucleic acid-binding protein
VERRLGRDAACDLLGELVPQIDIVPVDESLHDTAVRAFLASTARRPSLVDFTSFELMRRRGIRTALAVDRDFTDAGFDVIPA